MSADRRQRVILLDQGKSFGVAALGGHLQISLDRNMGRTCRLAGSCSGIIGLDPVRVAVIPVPVLLAPVLIARKQMLRVFHRAAVLLTELLTELYRARRTVLNASSAGDAVFGIHARDIGRAGHIRSIEELRCPERIADIDIAVADRKDLVLPVDIGRLVHKAVVLRPLHDLKGFLLRDITAALSGLDDIIRHIAHRDAPVRRIIPAALVVGLPAPAAGTWGRGVFALVLVEPVGDVLEVH